MFFVNAGETALDDVIGLKNSSTEFTRKQDKTGTGQLEVVEDEGFENLAMGVGKNTTSKVLETSSEAGKYEDDGKHGACFYPIPVHNCFVELQFVGLLQFHCIKGFTTSSTKTIEDIIQVNYATKSISEHTTLKKTILITK